MSRLMAGTDVAIDGCSTNPIHRTAWLQLATLLAVDTRLVVVHCPLAVAHERQDRRDPTERVPPQIIVEYAVAFAGMLEAIKSERWTTVDHIIPAHEG